MGRGGGWGWGWGGGGWGFFFNDTATTEIYTLSLHDALPISDPDDPEHYVIHNDEEGTTWEIRAGSASDITGMEGVWKARSPASFLGKFRIFAGSITEDRVEFRYPLGKISIEFLGPRSLPSKMVMEEEGSEIKIFEYTYQDVGDVPDGMFSLPPDVTLQ